MTATLSNSAINTGQSVADALFSYQDAIDQTLARGSDLLRRMSEGRGEVRISAIETQPVMSKIVESLADVNDARIHIVAAQKGICGMGSRLGLEGRQWGDGTCPPVRVTPTE